MKMMNGVAAVVVAAALSVDPVAVFLHYRFAPFEFASMFAVWPCWLPVVDLASDGTRVFRKSDRIVRLEER